MTREGAHQEEVLDAMEGIMPGIGACTLLALPSKLSGCGTGAGPAKDRAAHALTTVSIPEESDCA